MSRVNGKIAASGILAFLCGAVGYTVVYRPNYSQLALERQAKLQEQPAAARQGGKGSMWSNMDKQIKERRG